MNKQIKEMLHCIEMNCKHNKCFGGIKLDEEDCKLLLDYITNLQQDLDKANDIIKKDRQFYKYRMDEYAELKKENERLKELNICVGCENNPDYKSRCLKAIEEINYWGIDKEHNDNSAMRLALGNILNILNGSDAK